MEELDDILLERHVDLDTEDPTTDSSRPSTMQQLNNEKLTDSMLRNDAFAPSIIHFTPTYNPSKRHRKMVAIVVILVLSVSSVLRLRKVVFSLSHEAPLDIEDKMEAQSDMKANDLAIPMEKSSSNLPHPNL